MKNRSTLSFILLAFALIIPLETLYATGSLFVRPRWSETEYQKVWIKSIEAKVNIHEQIAITHIDQKFQNELNESVEAIFIFPLNDDAVITELVYWVNGVRHVADIKERQDAINAYNQKLRQWLDPALLEELGDNLFRLSIVPVNANSEIHTEITYIEPLKYEFGEITYNYKLNTLGLSSKDLETVLLDVSLESQNAIKSFYSPSHENLTSSNITKISDNQYNFVYGDENFTPDKDFILKFETVRDDIDFKILNYIPSEKDSIGNDSFFALWITPPDSIEDEEVIPKNIVFTADISSSMEGTRLEQLKVTLNNFLELLNPIDKFNIITFGTFVDKFSDDLVSSDVQNISLAKEYVSKMSALGLTNIDEALKSSLQQSYAKNTSNNIIFLTDGDPTWGETDHSKIIQNSKTNNINDVRLYSFGIGETISKKLLTDLSIENHGFTTFISADDSISLIASKHFERMSKPVLTNISLDFDQLTFWDSYPTKLPDLHWGSQILYLGKYNDNGAYNVSLRGRIRGENKTFSKIVNFGDDSSINNFVPRLWARTKINHILGLIEAYGETEELKNQVIEIGLMFQILTPYTAFYVDPDENDGDNNSTDVDDESSLPETFKLEQNYPNPFNPSTTIAYSIPNGKSSYNVSLRIYDVLGELVAEIIHSTQAPGNYKVVWNGKNLSGSSMPSGIYFYTIEIDNYKETKKMILLR